MDKATLRKTVREAKQCVSAEEKKRRSRVIMERLENLPVFQQARFVLAYWSMDDEVSTHEMIERWYRQKIMLLPCVKGDELILKQYTGADCLHAGIRYGIGEPMGDTFHDLDCVEVAVVPGVAFDRQQNRMGRGRGFYDRLLATMPKVYTIGVAFQFQLFDHIPVDSHDVPMCQVLTDE